MVFRVLVKLKRKKNKERQKKINTRGEKRALEIEDGGTEIRIREKKREERPLERAMAEKVVSGYLSCETERPRCLYGLGLLRIDFKGSDPRSTWDPKVQGNPP